MLCTTKAIATKSCKYLKKPIMLGEVTTIRSTNTQSIKIMHCTYITYLYIHTYICSSIHISQTMNINTYSYMYMYILCILLPFNLMLFDSLSSSDYHVNYWKISMVCLSASICSHISYAVRLLTARTASGGRLVANQRIVDA